jgi:hypothetical protein
MMVRVYISRGINYYLFTGSPNEMLSSRVHRECWPTEVLIDFMFFWQKSHCATSYRWEKIHGKKKAKAVLQSEGQMTCKWCGAETEGPTFQFCSIWHKINYRQMVEAHIAARFPEEWEYDFSPLKGEDDERKD